MRQRGGHQQQKNESSALKRHGNHAVRTDIRDLVQLSKNGLHIDGLILPSVMVKFKALCS
jgi:hypothetical protein